jgi:translation elongation factor P/translation initiation factor 5A
MLSTIQQKRRDTIALLKVIKKSQRYKYNIQDIKVGGFFSYDNQTWQVKHISKYLDVKWSSFKRRKKDYFITELELFSLKTGEKKYIEYEYDDSLEIYETIKEIKLRYIKSNNQVLTKNILENISNDESGEIIYNNKKYFYSENDTWAALYLKYENDDGLKVRFYEFESDDNESLTIEVWYDDISDDKVQREAFISKKVLISDIEVLQLELFE